jgi:hypothetical protein
VDDPLQGVVHLDKPLLLCQEIYTRIIGNHQTSKVSKEKVLTLLRQDMEQHLQNRKDDDLDNESNDLVVAVNTDSSNDMRTRSKDHQDSTAVSDLSLTATSTDMEEAATSEAPVSKADTENDGIKGEPTVNEGQNVEANVSSSADSIVPPKEQPLVGYWAWENTLRTHKMKMHLAKGSDLALHIVLAVLVNQLRYERNAIALAV